MKCSKSYNKKNHAFIPRIPPLIVVLLLLLVGVVVAEGLPRRPTATSSIASSLLSRGRKKKTAELVDLEHSHHHQESEGSSTTANILQRGGSDAVTKVTDAPTLAEVTGVSIFIAIELIFRKILKASGINFPAQLAGCVFLFVTLILAQTVGLGDEMSAALSPGAGFLAKWMGVFFVPGLTMLPLAPSLGSPIEIAKALGVVVLGFYYSLALVSYAVLGVRKLMGTISIEATTTSATGSARKKPYQDETLSFLLKGAVASGVLRLALQCLSKDTTTALQKPLETFFFGFVTIGSYVWGANLPPAITKICNPLLTSALVTLGVARVIPILLKGAPGFTEILQSYTCKKLFPLQETGAGDILLFLLSPSVISFGVGMYKGKQLIATNLPAVVTAVLVGSLGSMFGTAAVVRYINLGGTSGDVIRLAAIPRSTQTALGMTIANMLGGDIAIAATLIILTGIYGGMMGTKTLDGWKIKDSVSRGLGIGSAGLSLGVVSIKNEPEAFAFAGLCLVLTAVSATCLASVPVIQKALIQIATGGGGGVGAVAAETAAAAAGAV